MTALLAVLAILAAQPIAAETKATGPKANSLNDPSAKLKIEGFDGTRYVKLKKQGFSASEILDVEFKTRLFHCPKGEHLLELKLYTPNGHLYQVLAVPVVVDAGKGKQSVMVKGFPKALTSQAIATDAKQGTERYFATATLPVAGTFITTNSLHGTWGVEAFLDGKQLRLIGNQSFSIRP
jgi:hypothetical protein